MGVPRQAGLVTSLSAVTATGAGSTAGADGRGKISLQVVAASVSTGGAIVLEGTLDDSSWCRLTPKDGDMTGLAIANRVGTISASGTYILEYENVNALKVRANLVTRTDGTYTAKIRVSD
jgi:hypothetical protein